MKINFQFKVILLVLTVLAIVSIFLISYTSKSQNFSYTEPLSIEDEVPSTPLTKTKDTKVPETAAAPSPTTTSSNDLNLYVIIGSTFVAEGNKTIYYLLIDKIDGLENGTCGPDAAQTECQNSLSFTVINSKIVSEKYLLDNDGDVFITTNNLSNNINGEIANSDVPGLVEGLKNIPFEIEIDEGEIESIEEFAL